MKSNNDNSKKKTYITIQLSAETNILLTESARRSGRKKIPEAALRLEDHLLLYRSISEPNQRNPYNMEDSDVNSSHS